MGQTVFEHRFSIPFQDIDAAGIVFFAHLFRYAHEAYEGFMAHVGQPLPTILADRRFLLPLVHAEADYQHPLRHGEAIRTELRVEELGDTSFTLGYRFIDEQGRQRANARTVHVVLDTISRHPSTIPHALRSALG